MATKKTKKLDRETLLTVLREVQALERKLEASAKANAREGGVMLAHATAEWTRATTCGLIITTLLDPMLATTDED